VQTALTSSSAANTSLVQNRGLVSEFRTLREFASVPLSGLFSAGRVERIENLVVVGCLQFGLGFDGFVVVCRIENVGWGRCILS